MAQQVILTIFTELRVLMCPIVQTTYGDNTSNSTIAASSSTTNYFAPHWGASFQATNYPLNNGGWAPESAPANSSAIFYMNSPSEYAMPMHLNKYSVEKPRSHFPAMSYLQHMELTTFAQVDVCLRSSLLRDAVKLMGTVRGDSLMFGVAHVQAEVHNSIADPSATRGCCSQRGSGWHILK